MLYLLSSLSFLLALMLQYGIVSRTLLLSGAADLVLLFVIAWSLHQREKYFWILIIGFALVISFISAQGFLFVVLLYLAVYLSAWFLRVRIWQSPLMAMLLLAFFATMAQFVINVFSMFSKGIAFSIYDVLIRVALPSLVLNVLLAIPVHALVLEMLRWIYPKTVEL